MRSIASVAAIAIGALWATTALAGSDVTVIETGTPFADVMSDLEDAVINRGYVVDYHGYIGEMLKRTAADVGAAKPLYRNAEFLQFCSAVVSREAMEADIANIAYCPYVLFVYEAEAAPGVVKVGFRQLPAGGGRDAVNALLGEIVEEAVGAD